MAALGKRPPKPKAVLCVSAPEHYLPLLYVLALRRKGEPLAFFNEAVENAMSMTSVVVGYRAESSGSRKR